MADWSSLYGAEPVLHVIYWLDKQASPLMHPCPRQQRMRENRDVRVRSRWSNFLPHLGYIQHRSCKHRVDEQKFQEWALVTTN